MQPILRMGMIKSMFKARKCSMIRLVELETWKAAPAGIDRMSYERITSYTVRTNKARQISGLHCLLHLELLRAQFWETSGITMVF